MNERREEKKMKQKHNNYEYNKRPAASQQSFELLNNLKSNPKLLHLTNDYEPAVVPDQTIGALPSPPRPLSPVSNSNDSDRIHHSVSNESNRSCNSNTTTHSKCYQPKLRPQFELSKLPTPRLALLTGNRKLISRLGQMTSPSLDPEDGDETPYCYLLKQPMTLRELTIDSTEDMSGHILVCMHHKVSNIFKFIFNLRSPQLQPYELKDIVFLCTSLPHRKTFESISRFPKVYFMLVSLFCFMLDKANDTIIGRLSTP